MNEITLDHLVIFASRSGNYDLLLERIEKGGNVNAFDNIHGSPLIAAITNNHLKILDLLISKGADVNVAYADDTGPLEIGLKTPNPAIVYRLVCAGAKLKKKTRPYYLKRLEDFLNKVKENI